MPAAATPRRKHSPSSSSSSSSPPPSSPHRSPRLIHLPSRSTPAPPLLDQMEELTIKDRRSQPAQGGKSGLIVRDSQESRMAGLGHQRRPADLGRPGPGPGPGATSQPHLPLGGQNQNQAIGFRSPSSEPSFMAPIHARSEYNETEGSSSSFSSSDQSTVRGGLNPSFSLNTTNMDEDEDTETIHRYQGGGDLERTHTRYTSFAPTPSSSRTRAQPRQPHPLRDPYDFSKSYDDDDDHRADDDDQSLYERNPTDEVVTRAGTPLFSAGPEERYELLQKLGQGNFGTVWKA
jgi:hypothetical protein